MAAKFADVIVKVKDMIIEERPSKRAFSRGGGAPSSIYERKRIVREEI